MPKPKRIGEPVELEDESKLLILDADTLAVMAAIQAQENRYRLIDEDLSGKHGCPSWKGKKDAYAWGKENDVKIGSDDLEEFIFDEGEVVNALGAVKLEIQAILDLPWIDDFRIYIEGEGNYRPSVATIWPYKGNRSGKPPLVHLKAVKDYLKRKYKDRVVESVDQETDDSVSIIGWKWYNHAKETRNRDASQVVLGFVDKDLIQIPGYHWNYQKPEEPVVWVNDLEAFRHFCWQLLFGDSIDNIPGLTQWSKELSAHYGLRKTATIGEVGCWNLIEDCKTKKELFEKVVDIYKRVYGEEPFDFTTYDGEEKKITWDYILNENSILLKMRDHEEQMYSFTADALEYGVEL